jgi:adenylate cyclase
VLLAAGTFCASVFTVAVLLHEPALLVAFNSAWVLSLLVAAGSSGYLLDRTQRVVWLREIDLRRAEERIRELLHNVLPPSIAARKLAGEAPIADQFADAGLLFADVVGVTTLSARLDSAQIVCMLSDLFSDSTLLPLGMAWKRSRRLATATWWPPEFPSRSGTISIS